MSKRAAVEVIALLALVALGGRLMAGRAVPHAPCEALANERLLRLSQAFSDPDWGVEYPPMWREETAQERGRREADEELRAGVAHLYGCDGEQGLRGGLPVFRGTCGCVRPPEDSDHTVSHDSRIREYTRLHGNPRNSRTQWEAEMMHVAAYVEKNPCVHLASPGAATTSPDGTTATLLSSSPLELRISIRGENYAVRLDADEHAKDAQVWWGPPGSDTLYVRTWTPSIHDDWIEIIDLRSGHALRGDFVSLH